MQRTGRKNDPAFRVVVAEHDVGPKSGKIVERVGSHHPKTKETILNSERIKYWMSVGAKASDRIHNMLIAEGIIEGKKINVLPKKTPVVKEEEPKEEVTAETPAEGEKAVTETKEETPAEEKPSEEVAEAPAEEEKKEEEAPAEEEKKEE